MERIGVLTAGSKVNHNEVLQWSRSISDVSHFISRCRKVRRVVVVSEHGAVTSQVGSSRLYDVHLDNGSLVVWPTGRPSKSARSRVLLPRRVFELLLKPFLQLLVTVAEELLYKASKGLAAFRIAGNTNGPWTVLCSYQPPMVHTGEPSRRFNGNVTAVVDGFEGGLIPDSSAPQLLRYECEVVFDVIFSSRLCAGRHEVVSPAIRIQTNERIEVVQ